MKQKYFIWIAVLLLIAVGAYLFYRNSKTEQANTINLGAVLPLSGDVAAYGKDSKDGIELAIELANKSQKQYNFKVSYEDSKGDPKTAVTALQSLLSTKSPIAVIGENISSSTGAMIPVADNAKVFLISPSASAPNLSGLSRYFFRVFPSDIEEGIYIVDRVSAKFPNSKASIIYVNNDYGLGLKSVFEEKAKEKGISVVATFGYAKGAKDFKPILTKVKSSASDIIYMPGYYEDAGLLLKQAKELGVSAQFFGSTAEEDPKLLEIAGASAEGFQYPVSTGFDISSNDSTVVNFIKNFKSKFGKDPGLVSSLGFDCANLIISGILKNGATSEGIRSYLLTVKNIPGSAGVMNFDDKGDVHKPIILKQIKDGKFSIVQ